MIYVDTSYIIKSYLNEPGSAAVLDLLEQVSGRASALHARTEFWAGVHRHVREANISRRQASETWRQLAKDEADGHWHWLPLTDAVIRRSCTAFESLEASILLRSADALHLACAALNGFKEIYSNDRRLLSAAPHFGLTPANVIEAS